MVKLADVIIQSAKRNPSATARQWFLEQLLTVSDPTSAPIAAEIFKSVAKPADIPMLSPARGNGYENTNPNIDSNYIVKMHPIMFRAWVSSAWASNSAWVQNYGESPMSPDRVARQLYMKDVSQTRRNTYLKILRDVIPKNSNWQFNFQSWENGAQYINRSKPCRGIHAIVVDPRRAGTRTVHYDVGSVRVPVRIQPTTPGDVIDKFASGMISLCEFSISLLYKFRAKIKTAGQVDIFVLDGGNDVIGAATCQVVDRTLVVKFLCSSRSCKGAGSFVMGIIEKFAMARALLRIKLTSNARARDFYTKIGYAPNGRNNNNMEKMLGGPAAPTGKRNRVSPNTGNRRTKRRVNVTNLNFGKLRVQ